jgi:hypothetical protein
MPASETVREKRKLNAVDWFLIVAVILCLAAAAVRLWLGPTSGALTKSAEIADYVVSFRISNIRNSSTRYLVEGEEFYIPAPAQYFGSVLGNISVTPALFHMQDAEGRYLSVYAPENGDATRIDVTGAMLVSGCMSENGFLLGGTTPLAVNKTIVLRSAYLYVTITVTDISRAA